VLFRVRGLAAGSAAAGAKDSGVDEVDEVTMAVLAGKLVARGPDPQPPHFAPRYGELFVGQGHLGRGVEEHGSL